MRATKEDQWPSYRTSVKSHVPPGVTGVSGPPGSPPIVGIFRWCKVCNKVSLAHHNGLVKCLFCRAETMPIINAWCPKGAILVWSEESAT